MNTAFITGADLLGTWLRDVQAGTPPVRFTLAKPFEKLDLRPGRLILFGGPPGSGKTAALMQIGTDLLRRNPSARLLVANVEMMPALLLERIVSRLSGVPLKTIMDRTLTKKETDRINTTVKGLGDIAGRLAFLQPPYSLEHVAAAGTAFGANALILDYAQRFTVGDGTKTQREVLEDAVTVLRRFADAGAVVLVACAVARQKSTTGSSYQNLNLASFRGSSEFEFGADSAYLLDSDQEGGVLLRCGKNRYGPLEDLPTSFDGTTQAFNPAPMGLEGFDAARPAPSSNGRGTKGVQ